MDSFILGVKMRVVSGDPCHLARDSYECAARSQDSEQGPAGPQDADQNPRADHGKSQLAGRISSTSHDTVLSVKGGGGQSDDRPGMAVPCGTDISQAGRYVPVEESRWTKPDIVSGHVMQHPLAFN